MIRFIAIAAIVAGILYFINKLFKSPRGSWKEPAKLMVPLLALVLLLFVVTGKAHILGIMLAGLVPLLKNITPYLLQYGPKYFQKQNENSSQEDLGGTYGQQSNSSHPPTTSNKMSREEALEILGLEEGATVDEIKLAHRRLMQKVHPDHGGNDYLATKLNEAKKLLTD